VTRAAPTGSPPTWRPCAQRTAIETEITRWEAAADEMITKAATWGVARVEKGMAPILREIDRLHTDLARLEQPDTAHAATADAVAAWGEAADRGDTTAQRAMIRRAFPNLTLAMPARYGDHGPDRLRWDG
jgi:hypothetical protein